MEKKLMKTQNYECVRGIRNIVLKRLFLVDVSYGIYQMAVMSCKHVITFSLLIFKIVTAKPYISRNDHT